MIILKNFNTFLNMFKKDKLWLDMENTIEDSPYHREANVAVHTQMLLDWYISNLASKRSEEQQVLTLISCLFHDVGKPRCEIVKFSESRGEYRAYHGHEKVSARMWVQYALVNHKMLYDLFNIDISAISDISYFIENHLPYKLEDKKKRQRLKSTFYIRGGEQAHRAWLDFIMSDQYGRYSDNMSQKINDLDVWLNDWEKVNVVL